MNKIEFGQIRYIENELGWDKKSYLSVMMISIFFLPSYVTLVVDVDFHDTVKTRILISNSPS